jgi:uncharacterized protein (TIGR02453 family)
MAVPPPFQGFHPEAVTFFHELAADNSKAFFDAHRATYEEHVRAPMQALERSLSGLFGDGHLYRPHRDVRFSKDKRPYKLNAAVSFGGRGPRAVGGRHVHLDADGMFVAVGAYRMEGEVLAAFRQAVAADPSGQQLEHIVAELTAKGYPLHGEELKRAPRGFAPDHPRLDLLRRKGLAAVRHWRLEPWVFTPEAGDRILSVFADGEPLVGWLRRHVG